MTARVSLEATEGVVRSRLNFRVILIVGGLVASMLTWAFVFLDLRLEHRSQIRTAEANASNLAKAFSGQEHALLAALDEFLLGVRADYLHDREHFQIVDWVARQFNVARDLVVNLSLANETGLVLQSSVNPAALVGDSIKDREHFRVHADSGGLDRLFVSRPLIGRVSLKPSIQVTRPVYDAERRFARAPNRAGRPAPPHARLPPRRRVPDSWPRPWPRPPPKPAWPPRPAHRPAMSSSC